ncbi:MAG: hypothetical protein H6738_20165 [Alphaproteobacteria bacterium]|nr:hypothetical protein [Alphaproteobacteria bacterium]
MTQKHTFEKADGKQEVLSEHEGGSLVDAGVPCADGVNSLVRNHWFNGKLLTGKALSREQHYNDLRDRLVAQIHGAGIAWGLGLELPPAEAPLPPRGAFEPSDAEDAAHSEHLDQMQQLGGLGRIDPETPLVLQAGLAFDDTGTPIFVRDRHTFTLDALIDRHVARPAVATRPRIQFSPCICLHETGHPPGYAGFQPGVYLLVIEHGSCPVGPAKVHDAVCKGAADPCLPDAVREGFRLRLVFLPCPWQSFHDASTPWAMRSNLAHWYHEVFEHPLHERWSEPPMPAACEAAAQRTPGPTAIPLAAVFLDQDRSATLVDPWIPRRYIVDTRSSQSLRSALGAPTRAASEARLRQFQCQLNEARRLDGATRRNLYDLGFRAIPPAGFLPLDIPDRKDTLRTVVTFSQLTAARKACQQWFRGTNLIPIIHTVPMDEDVLLELERAWAQDMVPVRPAPEPLRIDFGKLVKPRQTIAEKMDAGVTRSVGALLVAGLFRAFGGATMEQLVNREIAFVRVLVPMQGMRRDYPGIGRVKGMRTANEAAVLRAAFGLSQTGDGGHDDPFLADVIGLSANPYPWAVYHRARVVLLDVLYMLLDVLGDLLLLLASTGADLLARVQVSGGGTSNVRKLVVADSAGAELLLNASGLTESAEVRESLVLGTLAYAPDAGAAGLWTRYRRVEREALAGGADPVEAADRATDAVMEVSPAGNVLRVFGVIAPATRDAMVSELESLAATEGGTRERDTLAMRAYHPEDSIGRFEKEEEHAVFVAMDEVLRETPLTAMAGLEGRSGTAGDLLDRTEVDIRRDQPDGTRYVSDKLVGNARKVREASVALADAGWSGDASLREQAKVAFAEAKTVEEAVAKVRAADPKAAEALAAVGDTLGIDAARRFLDKSW